MSDTPRTDAAYFKPHATMYDLAGEMKLIERELNAANAIIRQQQLLEEENLRLQGRIKRLEEAGDALCENSDPSRWDSPEAAARKMIDQLNWNKAKEVKL